MRSSLFHDRIYKLLITWRYSYGVLPIFMESRSHQDHQSSHPCTAIAEAQCSFPSALSGAHPWLWRSLPLISFPCPYFHPWKCCSVPPGSDPERFWVSDPSACCYGVWARDSFCCLWGGCMLCEVAEKWLVGGWMCCGGESRKVSWTKKLVPPNQPPALWRP